MFCLGKKLSSVLLCGSMAVTLLGNSGVHAADEVAMAIEDESEEVTAVDEHDDKVENDDKGNENTELDTDKEYQYVAKEDVTAQDPAKRSGSSFAVNVAKGLGTVALGSGIGFGLDEGWRRIGKDSSGNEAGGQAPIVSKDGTRIEVLESQVSELQKKLEEGEKIYLDNLAYGSLFGKIGEISKLRDIVSSKLGRDFDVKSKDAITGMIISYTIGLALFLWNLAKVLNKRPNGKIGWTYTTVKMLTDVALPPIGLILQCGESIVDIFKSVFISSKKSKFNKKLNKGRNSNTDVILPLYNNFYGVHNPNSNEKVNKNNSDFNVNNNINKKNVHKPILDKEGDVQKVTKYLKSLGSFEEVVAALKSSGRLCEDHLNELYLDGNWNQVKEDITKGDFINSINRLSLNKIKTILVSIGVVSSNLTNLQLKDPVQFKSTNSYNNNNNFDGQMIEQYEIDDYDNNNIFSDDDEEYEKSRVENNDVNFNNKTTYDAKVVEQYLKSLDSYDEISQALKDADVFEKTSFSKLEKNNMWVTKHGLVSFKIEKEDFIKSIKKLDLEKIKEVLDRIGCFASVENLKMKDKEDLIDDSINNNLKKIEYESIMIVRTYLEYLSSTSEIKNELENTGYFVKETLDNLGIDNKWSPKVNSEKRFVNIDRNLFITNIKKLGLEKIKGVLRGIGCFTEGSLDNLKLQNQESNYNDIITDNVNNYSFGNKLNGS